MAVDKVVHQVQDLLETVVTVEVLVKTVVMLKITKVEHEEPQEMPSTDGVIEYQERVLVMETAEVTQ